MRAVLFCVNPYAFGILKPLHDALTQQQHEILWYIPDTIAKWFPFTGTFRRTNSIAEISRFNSDAIFVPGNEVPHYLRGVKVQVFHGLAGEKQGHFRIRSYFDLYLTQGPYFTERFNQLLRTHGDFKVSETGWCKLDPLYQQHDVYLRERDALLTQAGKKKLVLYAPTFSPSLTSATTAQSEIFNLADQEDILLLIKFHDLMNIQVVNEYKVAAQTRNNVTIVDDRNILKYLIMADVMISDTSSVVYEFLLLNKPAITIRSSAENITWCNLTTPDELQSAFRNEILNDPFKAARMSTIAQYHPYTDGRSAARMIAATEDYIYRYGVPQKRNINFYRRYKMNKMFGRKPE